LTIVEVKERTVKRAPKKMKLKVSLSRFKEGNFPSGKTFENRRKLKAIQVAAAKVKYPKKIFT